MDGPAHYRKAEELAAKASEYLGRGDGQDSAAVWAAVAQVHATLAQAAATALGPSLSSIDRQQWVDQVSVVTRPDLDESAEPGVRPATPPAPIDP